MTEKLLKCYVKPLNNKIYQKKISITIKYIKKSTKSIRFKNLSQILRILIQTTCGLLILMNVIILLPDATLYDRGSYMSACVLLNLLNKLGENVCLVRLFFATSLVNLII